MRYYFHLWQDGQLDKDAIGIEFDDIEEAVEESVQSCREMIAEYFRAGKQIDIGTSFEIWDETGKLVHLQPFSGVILDTLTLVDRNMGLLGHITSLNGCSGSSIEVEPSGSLAVRLIERIASPDARPLRKAGAH